jgi:hypothetical protein
MTHPLSAASPDRWRLLTGFALLPIVNAIVAYLAFPVVWYMGDHGASRPIDPTHAASVFGMLAGVMGLLVTLCGALPVVWSLMTRGPVSFAQILVAGVALGNVPFGVYALFIGAFSLAHIANGTMAEHLIPLSDLVKGVVRAVAIGSVLGLTSAVVFWFVGVSGSSAARR